MRNFQANRLEFVRHVLFLAAITSLMSLTHRSADAFLVPQTSTRCKGIPWHTRTTIPFQSTTPVTQTPKRGVIALASSYKNNPQTSLSMWNPSSWWRKLPSALPSKVLSASLLSAVLLLTTPVTMEVGYSGTTSTTPFPLLLGAVPMSFSIVPATANALTEQQSLVDDVWKEVTRQFVDRTFNGLGDEGWRKKRLDAVTQVTGLGPDDDVKVYQVIRTMLSALGDPYTRFLDPDQFEALTSYAKGTSTATTTSTTSTTNANGGGVGVTLIGDPRTGSVIVLNTSPQGPAAQKGLRSGDVVVSIDGVDVRQATPEAVAAKCRGASGTEVTLAVQHGGDGKTDDAITTVSLVREPIPKRKGVQASVFVSSKGGKKVGVITIPSFTQGTVQQVEESLKELRRTGNSKVGTIVLDLRGNMGGYMPAGVDVAKLFLPPQARIISEVDKSARTTIYINDGATVGGSDIDSKLYVLVDQRTASASEILTVALQDNHRATVVGATNTFGKGRIQNIQELQGGTGISVTKAKYVTPSGADIQGIGITPNVLQKSCGEKDSVADCLVDVL